MIAIDTNVLIRLLVGDDPKQSLQAESLLRDARESAIPCFISDPVLCEMEWVLESCYDATRTDILTALRDLLGQDDFVFEDRQALAQALDSYQSGKAEFSDYLIGANAKSRGATATYTFDRDLRRADGFIFLS